MEHVMTGEPLLFALHWDRALADRIARAGKWEAGAPEEREFEDGEHKTRPRRSVRGRDVYVLCSLHGDDRHSVNDKLCRLLFFLGALGDAGARSTTAVLPYLCYARKDRRTKPRDPVTTRYVAQLLEAVGTRRVLTVDVHNPAAYDNAFRIPAAHLEARWLLARAVAPRIGDDPPVVVSPDVGGAKRADRFRQALQHVLGRSAASAFVEKYRSEGRLSGSAVIGEVTGRVAVVVDDLVSSGSTLARAAQACMDRGAKAVHAVATHGLFVGDVRAVLSSGALGSVTVTDTVPIHRVPSELRGTLVHVVSVAPLLAEAIARLHTHGSIVEIVEHPLPPTS